MSYHPCFNYPNCGAFIVVTKLIFPEKGAIKGTGMFNANCPNCMEVVGVKANEVDYAPV